MAKLTPVDFDPFAQADFSDVATTVVTSESPAAPTKRVKTTPIDYDPFKAAPADTGYFDGISRALKGLTMEGDAPLLSRVEGVRQAITPDILLGAQGRGLDVLGSVTRGIANVAEPIGDALESAIPLSGLTEQQIRGEKQLQPLYSLADALKGGAAKLQYQDGATWEDVKADPLSMSTPQFIAEQGILSLPDMAGSVAALPAYMLGRTEEIAERRVENDGRQGQPELSDMLAAAPGAVIESLLERFATKRLPVASGGGSAAARVTKETAVQAATEAVEEGAANLAESVGTQRGVDLQELADASGAGALTGGGIGAGTRVATEVAGRPGEARPQPDTALSEEVLAAGREMIEKLAPQTKQPVDIDDAPIPPKTAEVDAANNNQTPAKTSQEAPQDAPEPEAPTVAAPEPVEALAGASEGERRQSDRRRFETADDAAVSDFKRRSADLALTPEQEAALAPKGAPRDRTTGLVDGRQGERESSIERAQAHVRETTDPAIYVAGDIANLGGLNDHFGNRQADTDVHFKAMSDIFQQELAATGADIVPMRTGGDELGAVVVGADQAAVDVAADRARSRIADYAVENGLSDIPHPKGGQSGTGMHFGSSPIVPGMDVQDIINRADDGINVSKKERKNVRGSTPQATGTGAPEGQPGSVGARVKAPDSGVRRQGREANAEGSTPPRTTSLKNEVTDAEREREGRDRILRDTVVENRSAMQSALTALDNDPKLGEKTATKLRESGQAGTLEDSAVLLADRMRLMNERADLEKVATDLEATPQDQAQAILELDALEQKITANDLAAVSVGTEAARILQLRTRIINDDFTVENLERRERIQKGRPLTADERATIKRESEAVQGAQKAVAASDQKLEDATTNEAISLTYKNMIREMADQLGVGGSKRKRGKTLEALKSAAEESKRWLRESQGVSTNKQAGAVMDPRAFFHLARIGAYHIANGANTLAEFVSRMKSDLGDALFGKAEPAIEDVYEAAKVQHAAAGGGDPVAKAMESVEDGKLTHANVYNIAKAHITAGVKGEAAVMAATLDTLKVKFPELTERDVRRLFSDYGRARFPSKDADAREARRLKTLVRLQESIDRLREGLPALRTGAQRDKADADIRARQRQLNDMLKLSEAQNGLDPARLASYQQARANNLRNQIEDLNREIATGEKKTRPESPADNAEVAALRAERDRLKAELKRLDEIANPPLTEEQKYQKRRGTQLQKMLDAVNERISKGDYSKNVRPEPRELTQENQRLHYALQEAKAKIARRQLADMAAQRPALKKIFGFAGESLNAARSVMLSFDDSFVLNQGGLYMASRPWEIPKVIAKSMKAFFNPAYALQQEQAIKKRENYPLYVKSGLPLVGEASPKVANQDEVYDTRWLEKFTEDEIQNASAVSKAGKTTRNVLTAGLRASQRAYNVAANQVRADWFDSIHNSASRANVMTKQELQDISRIVSVMTGRSSIKDVQQAAGLMSKMFLAWHWTASRFQTVLGTPVWQASPRMKKYMAAEYARVMLNLAALQGMLYFGAMVYNAQHDDDDEEKPITDFDPRSGNFMKYRFGNTWVGMSAGIGPTLAFMSRMLTGETVSKGKVVPLRKKGTLTQLIDWSQGREIVEKKPSAFSNPANVILDWYHSRSSPAANYVLSAFRGQNAAKQEFDPARDALGMVTPINFDDVFDILKDNGPVAGTAMLAWRFFGGNTDFRDPTMKYGEREPLPWDTTDKERP